MSVLVTRMPSSLLIQLLIIIAFTLNYPAIYIAVFALVLARSIYYLYYSGIVQSENILYFFGLFICVYFGLVFNLIEYPTIIIHSLIAVITFTAAILYVKDLLIYKKISKYLLIIFQVIILIVVARIGFNNFPAENPLEELIEGSSSNAIPTITIVLQINYFIAKYFAKKGVPIITSIITLIIAIIGYGRGSIISAFFILVLALICTIKIKNVKQFFFFSLPVLALLVILIYSYYDEISTFIYLNTKLSAGLVDYHRERIFSAYFSQLDVYTLIAGADYPDFVKYDYNSNPHNSFIRAHHFFGIFYVLFILVIPIVTLWKLSKLKDKTIVFFLLVVLFFRCFSEPVLFPTIFDFYFFASFYVVPKLYLNSISSFQVNAQLSNQTQVNGK